MVVAVSYLSQRMREEGFWGRPKASELTVTITVDMSAFDQKFADALARLVGRSGRWEVRPDPANPPPSKLARRLAWDAVFVDETERGVR